MTEDLGAKGISRKPLKCLELNTSILQAPKKENLKVMLENYEQSAVGNSLKKTFLLNFVIMSKIFCSRFQFCKDNFLSRNEVTLFAQNDPNPF